MAQATLQIHGDHLFPTFHSSQVPSNGHVNQTAIITQDNTNGIYHARMGPTTMRPKDWAQAGCDVVLKMASTLGEVRVMEKEYKIYAVDLLHLQGTVIPRCYGFYKGTLGGEPVACLVLEPVIIDLDKCTTTYEFHRQLMVGFCKIHQAGVNHGDLLDGDHIGRIGMCPRIFSFSKATKHRCRGCPPADYKGNISGQVATCRELFILEKCYGLKSGDPPKEDDERMSRLGQVMSKLKVTFSG